MPELSTSPVPPTGLPDHPAVRAWAGLRPRRARPTAVGVLKDTRKTGVFRLEAAGPGGAAVIAKRCRRGSGEVERTLYEEVFPRLPVRTPRCHGFVEDGPESCWLFLEDADGETYSPGLGGHGALAARWLAGLHTAAGALDLRDRLPGRGPDHYRAELRAATGRMRHGRDNPALRPGDGELLGDVLARCADLDGRWALVERLGDGLPRTLVHGDFVPKNLRIRPGPAGPLLLVFDWEVAGWGLPAADVAECADLDAYTSAARAAWPHVGGAAVRRLAFVGALFRLVSALSWASWDLGSARVSRCLTYLGCYRDELTAALAADRWGD